MLVLEGGQGLLKSTALKTIASLGDDETLFSDVDVNLHSKDTLIDLQGVWIQEIAELDGLDKADITRIKAFLSRSNDRFRSPYGVETQDHPRRFVFAGTINPGASAQYLRDPTGGRRFWPVRVQKADIDALRAARDALWAEAVHRFCAGEAWWLDEEGLARDAEALQADRTEIDPLLERVALFLEDMDRSALKSAANRGPYYEEYGVVVSAYEIAELAMEIPPKDITPALGRRIASMMTALGWQAVKLKHGPRRDQRVYHKPTAAPSEPEAEQHHEPAFEDYQ
jgi:predicted P-loop ATPase